MGKEIQPVKSNPTLKRQQFDKAFKLNAVAMLQAGQKPTTQLALELGIRRNLLYKWAEVLERSGGDVNTAFNGPGHNKLGKKHDPLIAENKRLKRELARANAELDILKRSKWGQTRFSLLNLPRVNGVRHDFRYSICL